MLRFALLSALAASSTATSGSHSRAASLLEDAASPPASPAPSTPAPPPPPPSEVPAGEATKVKEGKDARAAYDGSVSTTGKLYQGVWSRRLLMGLGKTIGGESTGEDYVWMEGLATHTVDRVSISFFSRDEAAAKLPPHADGVLGMGDAARGSFLAALYGRWSIPEAKASPHTYGVSFGRYSQEKKRFLKGSLQYDGVDTGTFEEPEWSAARDISKGEEGVTHFECSRCAALKDIRVNGKSILRGVPNNSSGGVFPDVESFPASLRSAHPSISFPEDLVRRIRAVGIAGDLHTSVNSITLQFIEGQDPAAKTEDASGEEPKGFTVELGVADLLTGLALQDPGNDGGVYKGVVEGPQIGDGHHVVLLGAPLFRAGNVVMEARGQTGVRNRFGFAKRRAEVSSTEAFKSARIASHAGFGTAAVAIGGPWGRVQKGFNLIIDTNSHGFAVASGVHFRGVEARPFVGTFYHAVFVHLVVLPACIALVLREAAQSEAASAASAGGGAAPSSSRGQRGGDIELSAFPSGTTAGGAVTEEREDSAGQRRSKSPLKSH